MPPLQRQVPEGVRVVIIRTGIVLARDGGALSKLLPSFEVSIAAGSARSDSAQLRAAHRAIVDQLSLAACCCCASLLRLAAAPSNSTASQAACCLLLAPCSLAAAASAPSIPQEPRRSQHPPPTHTPPTATHRQIFAGGPLGSGRQWLSWVHRDDLVDLMATALINESYSGCYNGVAPRPVTMAQLCSEIGGQLGKPRCARGASVCGIRSIPPARVVHACPHHTPAGCWC